MNKNDVQIHLFNMFASTYGGAEIEAFSLFNELKPYCHVTLWGSRWMGKSVRENYQVNEILVPQGNFPRKGIFVFIGAYFGPGEWFKAAHPHRVILLYNTFQSKRFEVAKKILSASGSRCQVEVVFVSNFLRRTVNFPGRVEYSPIDIKRFYPDKPPTSNSSVKNFIIGRLSRDICHKHHTDDAALYRELVNHGCSFQIMGGTCLDTILGKSESIKLLPEGALDPHVFLQGLDVFFYRTSDTCVEAYGRVVAEAMACGLPVVCHNKGGYVELIDNSRNGFLFDTQQEAMNILLRLKGDHKLRKTIGAAARETAESIYSRSRRLEFIKYLLNPTK